MSERFHDRFTSRPAISRPPNEREEYAKSLERHAAEWELWADLVGEDEDATRARGAAYQARKFAKALRAGQPPRKNQPTTLTPLQACGTSATDEA